MGSIQFADSPGEESLTFLDGAGFSRGPRADETGRGADPVLLQVLEHALLVRGRQRA